MKIYCLSGLGADQRAFQLINFGQLDVIHIPWLDPLPKESLVNYAYRMGEMIDNSEPFILLGLSFGGMLALEISKFKKPQQLILLSSITKHSEKPLRMRIAGAMKLYQFVPKKYFTRPNKMAHVLFGTTTPFEKDLLDQILRESDPVYIRWALNAIVAWKNTEIVDCKRIHGTKDRIFPIGNMKIDCIIDGGGHFMVVSHAKQVSASILSMV